MFDVITLGSATRDVFLSSPLFKVLRDPNHLRKIGFPTGEAQCFALGGKLEVSEPVMSVGGGAANAAVTFARQGLKAGVIAKVGRDISGEMILDDFKKEKIYSLFSYDREKGTSYSVILLAPGGERTILNYRGASQNLTLKDLNFAKFKAKALYIVPGRIGLKVILKVVEKMKKNKNCLVAMNPSRYYLELGKRKLQPLLNNLDIIILNREEASYLTGKPYEKEKEIFAEFDRLVGGIAVMTEGKKGVLVSDGRRIYQAGIYRERRVVDRTGAGDAFGSGFVAGLLSRIKLSKNIITPLDIEYAIRLGSANATSVVEHIGAQAGILKKKDFRNARWSNLPVRVYPI